MSGAEVSLAISVFLACAVEAVEALTIVLAVGSTPELVLGARSASAPRCWRSPCWSRRSGRR